MSKRYYLVVAALFVLPSVVVAGIPQPYIGTYEGLLECHDTLLVLAANEVSVDGCRAVPYDVVSEDGAQVVINLHSQETCSLGLLTLSTLKTNADQPLLVVEGKNFFCGYEHADEFTGRDLPSIFEHSSSAELRERALHSMNLLQQPKRQEFNEKALADPDPEVRQTAAFFLRGEPQHFVPLLINTMVHDVDEKVRERAAMSLSVFYTSNGSDGSSSFSPVEANLDSMSIALNEPKTERYAAEILGASPSGTSYLPCYMSKTAKDRVVQMLKERAAERTLKGNWEDMAIANLKACVAT